VILIENELKRTGIKGVVVSIEDLAFRYNSSASEILDFCDLFRRDMDIGVHLTHPFISKVMAKDEGFEINDQDFGYRLPVTNFTYNWKRQRVRKW